MADRSRRKDHTPKAGVDSKLAAMSMDFFDVAVVVGQRHGSDPSETAMALAHAATRLLFMYSHDDAARMGAAEIMAKCGIQAMADMISGEDATHQVRQ